MNRYTEMQVPTRAKLRIRKIGSNILSDKYTIPPRIEDTFKDLALFVAHTGFANVRQKQKMSDIDILPIFRSVVELALFLRQVPHVGEVTCGFAFQSLDMAWQIFQQSMIAEGNTLWYILDELQFILYIQRDISKSTFDVFTDHDVDPVLGPMHTTFRPDIIGVSIDSFICNQINQHLQKKTSIAGITQQLCMDDVYAMTKTMPSSVCIHNAISMMYPRYMKIHGLSRNAIANRVAKCRHTFSDRFTEYSSFSSPQ